MQFTTAISRCLQVPSPADSVATQHEPNSLAISVAMKHSRRVKRACCLLLLGLTVPGVSAQSAFVGWEGETFRPEATVDDAAAEAQLAAAAAPGDDTPLKWIEAVSEEPRAFVWHNFMSAEEADHLIQLALPNMKHSQVVNGERGTVTTSIARSSSGAWVKRAQDPIVAAVEQRIANWTSAPVENGEAMHVLRYELGEQYMPHIDYYVDEVSQLNGGQRMATVIMYLSDVQKGGETVFPLSAVKPTKEEAAALELSECARKGVAIKARKGDALLFYSVRSDGRGMDPASLHASCPVLQGTKWAATKWLRENEWIDAPVSQLAAIRSERQRAQAAAAATEAAGSGSRNGGVAAT